MESKKLLNSLLQDLESSRKVDTDKKLSIFKTIFQKFDTDIGKLVLQEHLNLKFTVLNQAYEMSLEFPELIPFIKPLAPDYITLDQVYTIRDEEKLTEFEYNYTVSNQEINKKELELFKKDPKYSKDSLFILEKYKNVLKRIVLSNTQILQESDNDAVIKIYYSPPDSGQENYIIKVVSQESILSKKLKESSPEDFNQHVHEAFVGLIGGLNDLRTFIPNFAQVYGITSGKDCPYILDFSSVSDKCIFVIYEYIKGPTLSKFFKSYYDKFSPIDIKDIKNILLQIFYSIYEALERKKFTHYDLHYNNIIISPTSANKVKYLAGELEILNHQVVFIDYGSSHIIYNDEHYGRTFKGGIRNIEFWIHDIFKILMFLYTDNVANTKISNIRAYRVVNELLTDLLKFFVSDPEKWFTLEFDKVDWYGIEPFFFGKTFEEFLIYARKVCKY